MDLNAAAEPCKLRKGTFTKRLIFITNKSKNSSLGKLNMKLSPPPPQTHTHNYNVGNICSGVNLHPKTDNQIVII